EVALTFAFPAIGQVYVSAVFRNDQPLVSLGEVLALLFIPAKRTPNAYGFYGNYPAKTDYWEIDPIKLTLSFGKEKKTLSADQFYLGETDLFLTPDVFAEVFGLHFIINPYALTLNLQNDHPLP